MIRATEAALFNSANGANVAASFTTDKIRVEPCSEASLQLIRLGRSLSRIEPFPFDFAGIVVVEIREGVFSGPGGN